MKKILSLVLALALLMSCLCLSAASAEQGESVVVGIAGDPGNIGPFQGMSAGRIGILFTTYEFLVTKDGAELSTAAQAFFDYATSADAADLIAAAGAVAVAK